MRVSVELALDATDYAKLRGVCETFFILRGTHLSAPEALRLNGLFRFTDHERQCFGRMIANKFSYDDVADGRDIVQRHHTAICETGNKKLKADADRALESYESFIRDLWDDLRIHRLGAIIADRFDRADSTVRAAIG